MKLSVIIPAFNEERRILPTLEKVDAYLKGQTYTSEVIIVDDCSTDKTFSVVKEFIAARPTWRLFKNAQNLGKGASVKHGMLAAKGEFRLFSDADLSTPIEEVEKFFPYFDAGPDGRAAYDVVIGSRRVKGAQVAVRQPFMREAAGRVFSRLVRLLTLRGFVDTQCGFKMFTAQAAENIFFKETINRFGFDVEILYIAIKIFGYRVKEAPVVWMDSIFTRVRLLQDSSRMFVDLLRIPWNDLRGLYRK